MLVAQSYTAIISTDSRTCSYAYEEVDKLLFIRNLLGCHYNQWADALSDEEVLRFAHSVQSLYEGAYCSTCLSWIRATASGTKDISCNCGSLNVTPSV